MNEPKHRAHYASEPVRELQPRTLDYLRDLAASPFFKPRGLWYSAPCDGDGWEDWCEAENFGIGKWRHVLDVDMSQMLVLRSPAEIDAFTAAYAGEPGTFGDDSVNWLLVFDDYAGIEVAPYQRLRRLPMDGGYLWYYSWDCASGCVWDLSAVKSWGPPERYEPPEPTR